MDEKGKCLRSEKMEDDRWTAQNHKNLKVRR